jgi:hypothetical protein
LVDAPLRAGPLRYAVIIGNPDQPPVKRRREAAMKHQCEGRRASAGQVMFALAAVPAAALVFLIQSAFAFPFQRTESVAGPTLLVAQRSPETEESWIVFHLAMPEKSSIRDQYIRQEVLAALLRSGAGLPPDIQSCAWRVRRGDLFGDFSITVNHPNPSRRLKCIRSAVDYLLKQPIGEADFRSTPRDKAYFALWGWPAHIYAQPPALLKIYEKYSPLYQILSVGRDDLSGLSFDEFVSWLQVSRERKLISFLGLLFVILDSLAFPAFIKSLSLVPKLEA